MVTVRDIDPSRTVIDRLQGTIERDLTAAFKQMEEDMLRLVAKGAKEGWTPEQLRGEIDNLIGPEDEGIEAELRKVERALQSIVEKGAKTAIGDVVNWAGILYVRVKDQPGAGDKVNFRKLGKAPKDWKKGDPNPYEDKAKQLLDEAKGKKPDETPKKPDEKEPEKPVTPDETEKPEEKPATFEDMIRQLKPEGWVPESMDELRDYTKKVLSIGIKGQLTTTQVGHVGKAVNSFVLDRVAYARGYEKDGKPDRERIMEVMNRKEGDYKKLDPPPEQTMQDMMNRVLELKKKPIVKTEFSEWMAKRSEWIREGSLMRKMWQKEVRKHMQETREALGYSTIGATVDIKEGSNFKLAATLKNVVSNNIPSEWKLKYPVTVKKGKRGYFMKGGAGYASTIQLSGGDVLNQMEVAMHEYLHAVEHSNPEIRQLNEEFAFERMEGKKLRSLKKAYPYHGYGQHEMYVEDSFPHPYMAKVLRFHSPSVSPTSVGKPFTKKLLASGAMRLDNEFWTMGGEALFMESKGKHFYSDPELFDHIVGVYVSFKGTGGAI